MPGRTGNEKKITIEIDPQLRTDLHIYARKKGTTVKALIEEYVRETLRLAGTYSSTTYKPLVEQLLKEGRHTQSEIANLVCERLPWAKKPDVQQLVSDSKKLERFDHQVIEIPRKCLGFGDSWKKVKARDRNIPSGGEVADPTN